MLLSRILMLALRWLAGRKPRHMQKHTGASGAVLVFDSSQSRPVSEGTSRWLQPAVVESPPAFKTSQLRSQTLCRKEKPFLHALSKCLTHRIKCLLFQAIKFWSSLLCSDGHWNMHLSNSMNVVTMSCSLLTLCHLAQSSPQFFVEQCTVF